MNIRKKLSFLGDRKWRLILGSALLGCLSFVLALTLLLSDFSDQINWINDFKIGSSNASATSSREIASQQSDDLLRKQIIEENIAYSAQDVLETSKQLGVLWVGRKFGITGTASMQTKINEEQGKKMAFSQTEIFSGAGREVHFTEVCVEGGGFKGIIAVITVKSENKLYFTGAMVKEYLREGKMVYYYDSYHLRESIQMKAYIASDKRFSAYLRVLKDIYPENIVRIDIDELLKGKITGDYWQMQQRMLDSDTVAIIFERDKTAIGERSIPTVLLYSIRKNAVFFEKQYDVPDYDNYYLSYQYSSEVGLCLYKEYYQEGLRIIVSKTGEERVEKYNDQKMTSPSRAKTLLNEDGNIYLLKSGGAKELLVKQRNKYIAEMGYEGVYPWGFINENQFIYYYSYGDGAYDFKIYDLSKRKTIYEFNSEAEVHEIADGYAYALKYAEIGGDEKSPISQLQLHKISLSDYSSTQLFKGVKFDKGYSAYDLDRRYFSYNGRYFMYWWESDHDSSQGLDVYDTQTEKRVASYNFELPFTEFSRATFISDNEIAVFLDNQEGETTICYIKLEEKD